MAFWFTVDAGNESSTADSDVLTLTSSSLFVSSLVGFPAKSRWNVDVTPDGDGGFLTAEHFATDVGDLEDYQLAAIKFLDDDDKDVIIQSMTTTTMYGDATTMAAELNATMQWTTGLMGDVAAGRGNEVGTRRSSYDQVDMNVIRYVVSVLYLTTFAFGAVGNTLTIVAISMNRKLKKTAATCFMLNLAVADDLFMLSLPFMAYSTLTSHWPFGAVLCKLLSAAHGVNCYASIFTMVLMSADRYLAVVHPLTSIRYRTPRNALVACLVTWTACGVIMMPFWLYADTRTFGGGGGGREPVLRRQSCKLNWPSGYALQHQWFWTNFELAVGFAVPIFVMLACYLQLLYGLVRNTSSAAAATSTAGGRRGVAGTGGGGGGASADEAERLRLPEQARRPIRRVTAMVFVVTLVFVVCWTPYHILQYVNLYKQTVFKEQGVRPEVSEVRLFAIVNTVAQALVFASSCCNPFIYCISSKNFRKYRCNFG